MVTNASSWGEDWDAATEWTGDKAKSVGQAVGLVEADVIPGNPEVAGGIAEHLTTLGGAFDRAGQGFKAIDTGGWSGKAADGARGYLETCPPKWLNASDAFEQAGTAVAEYQRVLAESQAKAARAKEDLDHAEKASDAAREAHNAQVAAFNSSDRTGARPGEFRDPAAGDIAAAQHAIDQAKQAVREADQRAAKAVLAACQDAPAEPGWMAQIGKELTDGAQALGRAAGSVLQGAGGAAVELGKLARLINPVDPRKFLHPTEPVEAMNTMAMGVVGAFQDPYAAVKTVANVDGWRNDPGKAAGAMIPDALASLAGGAGVASRLGRGLDTLGKSGDDLAGVGGKLADNAPTPKPPEPPPQAPKPGGGTPWNQPGGTPWNQPGGGTPWNQPVGDGLGRSQFTPVEDPPAPQRGGTDDGFVRPSQQLSSPGQNFGPESPPMGREPGGLNDRPEAAEAPPGPAQHRAPDRFGDMGGPDSWLDDGTGRGPDFDDWDDGGPLGDRGPSSEPVPRESLEQVDERPGQQPDEPRQEQRHEDPTTQRDHTPDDGPNASDRDSHGDREPDSAPHDHIPDRDDLSPEDRARIHDDLQSSAVHIDPDALPQNITWRDSNELLYRMDDRDDLFETGAAPRNPENLDLDDYTNHDTPSGYVSWSRDQEVWLQFADRQYMYVTDAPGGIDVNASVDNHGYARQEEIAAPGGTAAERIVGRYRMMTDPKTGLPVPSDEFEPNPHYGTQGER